MFLLGQLLYPLYVLSNFILIGHVNPSLSHTGSRIPNGRIIGGKEAVPHSAPYMAAIIINIPDNPNHYELCGGALLSEKYVLTAGHCLKRRTIRHILLGAHNRNISEPGQRKIPGGIIRIHERFGFQGYRHDIAIVELEYPVKFSDHIKPIKLPSKSDANQSYTGETARFFGWGVTQEIPEITPNVLQYVDAPVIAHDICRTFVPPGTKYNNIYDEDICTSGEGKKGHCFGDSGGPLVLNNTLIGVISRGISADCEKSEPSVFTGVAHHLDWIEKHSDLVIV